MPEQNGSDNQQGASVSLLIYVYMASDSTTPSFEGQSVVRERWKEDNFRMTFALAASMHTGKSRTKGDCTVRAYIQKVNKNPASPTQDKEAAYHTVFSGEAFFAHSVGLFKRGC